MELIKFDNLYKVLQEFARDVGENYASVIESNKHNASHALSNAAKAPDNQLVTVETDQMVVAFDLPKYWRYIEHGTRPHWPPPSALMKWIEIKPVIPRPGKNGRIPTTKQLAYLIGRKIATVGTKGTEDLTTARDRTLAWWRQRITDALEADLQNATILQLQGVQRIIEVEL